MQAVVPAVASVAQVDASQKFGVCHRKKWRCCTQWIYFGQLILEFVFDRPDYALSSQGVAKEMSSNPVGLAVEPADNLRFDVRWATL